MRLNRKNKTLLVGIIIALIICYRFAVANTLEYYTKYESQKAIINNNLTSSGVLQGLMLREKQLNGILKQYNAVSGDSFQNDLLKQIATLGKKYHLKIVDFKEPHTHQDGDSNINSYVFSLEGSFNETLLLINKLENNPSLGFIRHVEFSRKKNYKNNTYYLITEIMLQKTETIQTK